jgi:hypothetical protein
MENFTQGNSSFIGFVQQGKIYNSYGLQIGYTSEEYNKVIQTAKEFEKILYEKGILQKPKTPEEINRELQETMKQMMLSIQNLNAEISTLKGTKDNAEQTKPNEFCGAVSRTRKNQNSEPSV